MVKDVKAWPTDPGIRYAGYTALRGVTPDRVEISSAGETLGRGARFGVLPLQDGRIYWYATVTQPANHPITDNKTELLRRFGEWHDPIPELLNRTPGDAVLRNDILDLRKPLPSFVNSRVVLIGDAAHAMTPNLGQGGNQALEDAVTLASFIHQHADIDVALSRYDAIRRPRTTRVARQSRNMGRLTQARNPFLSEVRDLLIRAIPESLASRPSVAIQSWTPPVLPPAADVPLTSASRRRGHRSSPINVEHPSIPDDRGQDRQ